jgi:hypothetical protein
MTTRTDSSTFEDNDDECREEQESYNTRATEQDYLNPEDEYEDYDHNDD